MPKRGFTPLEITGQKKEYRKNKSLTGFTLLETIIAIFVATIGILGAMSLIQRVVVSISISSSRLIGTFLAQEGIEIVRNVRDTNWLEARTKTNAWSEGLTVCPGTGFIADYKLADQIDPSFPCFSGQFLNIDSDGFYSYSPGVQTKFARKIIVTDISSASIEGLNVLVEVNWQDRSVPNSLSVQENIYNWR